MEIETCMEWSIKYNLSQILSLTSHKDPTELKGSHSHTCTFKLENHCTIEDNFSVRGMSL